MAEADRVSLLAPLVMAALLSVATGCSSGETGERGCGACSPGTVCVGGHCRMLCGSDGECGDNNLCNGAETCVDGFCQAALPLDCDDSNSCTQDACQPLSGCTHVNTCTCTTPAECDDGNPCTDDACNGTCSNVPNTTTCGDSNVCNGSEVCANGSCQPGAALNCDDGEVCTADGCEPLSGCVHLNVCTCATNPCAHGACTDQGIGYSCACDLGWEGPTCNVNHDDCTPNPCVHGGCADEVNAYTCTCGPGWQGSQCDVSQTAFYVAPSGGGTACSLSVPCALTTGLALLRAATPGMSADLHVVLNGGTYMLPQPIALAPADSGRNLRRVYIEARAGDVPVLSGGYTITGWVLYDAGRSIYRAPAAGLVTRQLFVNGVRAARARGVVTGAAINSVGYTISAPAIATWAQPSDVEVVSLVEWRAYRCGVASAAPWGGGAALTIDQPCWNDSLPGQPYGIDLPAWIENAYELLDEAGEWYLDSSAGFVYYKPRPGEDLATAEVVAPVLETLISASGSIDDPVHDITLRGLTFAYATWLFPSGANGYAARQAGLNAASSLPGGAIMTPGNVALSRVEGLAIERCTFAHLGAYALALEVGARNNRIEGNVFSDVSSGGLRIGLIEPAPGDARLQDSGNIVRNNLVTDVGREYLDAPGIFTTFAYGTLIEHNEVRGTPYSGISVGWGWSQAPTFAGANTVRANVVGPVMRRLKDGGGIYTLSNQASSLMGQNFVHDQFSSWAGLYLDNGTEGYTVEENVVASALRWYLVQHQIGEPAINNVVRNNVTDTAADYCCGGLGCCTSDNSVYGNSIVAAGAWPKSARGVIARAGLEPAFDDLRGTSLRVEAEDFRQGGEGVGYHDATSGNAGGAYRTGEAVDIYQCSFCSNGNTVGYAETGEWLRYLVDVRPAGTYTFRFSVATTASTNGLGITIDGRSFGSLVLPNTGDYGNYTDVVLSAVHLYRGAHEMMTAINGLFAFDGFTYDRVSRDCAAAGSPADLLTGYFDEDGVLDTLAIHQGEGCWDVDAGSGPEVWLSGWGRGEVDLVGDFDGDGRDDVVLMSNPLGDGLYHWDLAESAGSSFVQYLDTQIGYGPGFGACAKNIDGDPAEEVVIQWAPNICGKLDASHRFVMTTGCGAACP